MASTNGAGLNHRVDGEARPDVFAGELDNRVYAPQTEKTQALIPLNLFYGRGRKPLARCGPDAHWPDMWRIAWPAGSLSDMLNISRARDAAAAIAERGPPARNRRLFEWRPTAPVENGAASPVRSFKSEPLSPIAPAAAPRQIGDGEWLDWPASEAVA